MIAEQIMHKEVFTLRPHNTVREALSLMLDKNIRHIPITNEDMQLVGIVSQFNVRSFCDDKPELAEATALSDIMVKDPVTAHSLDFVEDIALIMYESKKSCLPVVSSGTLVGIITTTDLLHSYMVLTGATIPGSKFDIRVKNRPGLVYEITDVFKAQKANVISVLVYPDKELENHSIVSVRVRVLNPTSLIMALREQNFEVLWPNMPGMSV